jgi:acyl-coenzyme A thioesterase PaaI-like protein
VTTDSRYTQLSTLSEREHPGCFICGASNDCGLRLHFTVCPDGTVTTVFPCSAEFQGYNGIMHGGVISGLLDGAMTNCLFSVGITATTAELCLRFLHPVVTDHPATVKAWITKARPPLHIVEAELWQGSELQVRATGKFMEFRARSGVEFGDREATERVMDQASGTFRR